MIRPPRTAFSTSWARCWSGGAWSTPSLADSTIRWVSHRVDRQEELLGDLLVVAAGRRPRSLVRAAERREHPALGGGELDVDRGLARRRRGVARSTLGKRKVIAVAPRRSVSPSARRTRPLIRSLVHERAVAREAVVHDRPVLVDRSSRAWSRDTSASQPSTMSAERSRPIEASVSPGANEKSCCRPSPSCRAETAARSARPRRGPSTPTSLAPRREGWRTRPHYRHAPYSGSTSTAPAGRWGSLRRT